MTDTPKNTNEAPKLDGMKLPLKYSVHVEFGNHSFSECESGEAITEELLIISAMTDADGTRHQSMKGYDGNAIGGSLHPVRIFITWLMIGNLLAESQHVHPNIRKFIRRVLQKYEEQFLHRKTPLIGVDKPKIILHN